MENWRLLSVEFKWVKLCKLVVTCGWFRQQSQSGLSVFIPRMFVCTALRKAPVQIDNRFPPSPTFTMSPVKPILVHNALPGCIRNHKALVGLVQSFITLPRSGFHGVAVLIHGFVFHKRHLRKQLSIPFPIARNLNANMSYQLDAIVTHPSATMPCRTCVCIPRRCLYQSTAASGEPWEVSKVGPSS